MHEHRPVFSGSEIERFVEKGYLRIQKAIPSVVAQQCRGLAMEQLEIPASAPWPEPVVRGVVDGEPFHQAANAPRLLEAVDQLLDGERWQRRPNLGLLVIRFPSAGDPGDTGWHIDASPVRQPTPFPTSTSTTAPKAGACCCFASCRTSRSRTHRRASWRAPITRSPRFSGPSVTTV
jgi:hypothetical protein